MIIIWELILDIVMGVKFFSISPFPWFPILRQDRDVMAACSQKLKLTKDELSIARLHGAPAPDGMA